MKYDTDQLKIEKGKIVIQILITAFFLLIIVFVHEWTHDRILSIASVGKMALILLLLSTSIWLTAYLIRFVLRKLSDSNFNNGGNK